MTDSRPVVCFGEMLLRLSAASNGDDLATAPSYAVHVAGAEANVAVSLSSLGQSVRMATVLPATQLGERARAALEFHGIDTGAIASGDGRMGLFFINSQVSGREGGLIYDRTRSAFASAFFDVIDWKTVLSKASFLHISGVTAALGDAPLAAMHLACTTAEESGAKISFDCNFRPALWQGREKQAPNILAKLAHKADLLFAGPWDIAMLTGQPIAEEIGPEAFEVAAHQAFRTFSKLETIAATSRTIVATGHHLLGAHLARRGGVIHETPRVIKPVIDRIGSGDAFAAALLYGELQGHNDTDILDFALQACVMKHGIAGDFSTLSAAEIEAAR